jgi:hypothetical protein
MAAVSARPDSKTTGGGGDDGRASESLTTLRGAGVDVDVGRVVRVLVGLVAVTLAVLVVILFLAGVHRNDQITELHRRGVAVEVTVSGCMGLLGGSGSNAAGYQCRGSYTLDGHTYTEAIPGDTLHPPGTRLRAVAVPGDPALLSTAGAVAAEHASGRVFVLPAVLLAALVALAAAVIARTRRRATR